MFYKNLLSGFFFISLVSTMSHFQTTLFPSHASRDEGARNEEKKGVIEFHVIGNSLSRKPSRQLLMWLIGKTL